MARNLNLPKILCNVFASQNSIMHWILAFVGVGWWPYERRNFTFISVCMFGWSLYGDIKKKKNQFTEGWIISRLVGCLGQLLESSHACECNCLRQGVNLPEQWLSRSQLLINPFQDLQMRSNSNPRSEDATWLNSRVSATFWRCSIEPWS